VGGPKEPPQKTCKFLKFLKGWELQSPNKT
jgi:hypothetical protein